MERPDRRVFIDFVGLCRPVVDLSVRIKCQQFVQRRYRICQIGKRNTACRIHRTGVTARSDSDTVCLFSFFCSGFVRFAAPCCRCHSHERRRHCRHPFLPRVFPDLVHSLFLSSHSNLGSHPVLFASFSAVLFRIQETCHFPIFKPVKFRSFFLTTLHHISTPVGIRTAVFLPTACAAS